MRQQSFSDVIVTVQAIMSLVYIIYLLIAARVAFMALILSSSLLSLRLPLMKINIYTLSPVNQSLYGLAFSSEYPQVNIPH